ncbi:MAG: HAD-IIA family hydrolase [Anaerolineales bacterium]|nr:HAD-IIA family hydrolase [Anaerolineales bacterium]
MSENKYPPLKTILLDMDGVLWRGYEPVIDIQVLFEKIHQLGCQTFFVTNNSTQTIEGYLEKLSGFGVDISPSQIITSAEATASYLKDHIQGESPVYVVGEDGLKETISRYSFKIIEESGADQPAAVVVGLDLKLTYEKIYLASKYIREGVLFVGTNPDKTFPYAGGIAPGAGSIISPIESASGTAPVMIGKPEKHLYQLALDRSGSLPAEALMIGDRLETDILGAQRMGIRTGLVLTGITSRDGVQKWQQKPDMIAETAQDILENL